MKVTNVSGLEHVRDWEAGWPAFEPDSAVSITPDRMETVLAELGERLRDNYPFFHPAYAGQMLKPPHEIAVAAYAMAQRINPNNHALDGGPATAKLEREVISSLAEMFGYDPAACLGHLTSSGTIANLEALWIARSLHPDKAIAYSADAHYTHARMCEVIGARGVKIAVDDRGRMDLDDLRAKLATERIGTIVATLGTTSLGMIDPLPEILTLSEEHEARVHVDAAYGGFFRLLADGGDLTAETAAAFQAIGRADSIVVDPHKHAFQPYGCGSVLFRDAAAGRFYKHDSPYTYFTSNELHLGEISLECSRAGAAAAALWATLRCFPLSPEGLGAVLAKTRQAAMEWAELIRSESRMRLVVEPELDIIAFYPVPPDGDMRASTISALTQKVFEVGMKDASFYLAKLNITPDRLRGHDAIVWDRPAMTVLRSVLMKPEHLAFVPELHRRVVTAAVA